MEYELYIKPCDHCGHSVLLVKEKENLISCKNCGMGIYVLSFKTDDILEDWNSHDWDDKQF